VLWRRELKLRDEDLAQDTRLIREQIARRVERMVEARVRLLQVLASQSERVLPDDLRATARKTCEMLPECRSLTWIDAGGAPVLKLSRATESAAPAVDEPTPSDQALCKAAHAQSEPTIGGVQADGMDGVTFPIIVPAAPQRGGAIGCQTWPGIMLDRALGPSVRREFELRLQDAGNLVFETTGHLAWTGVAGESEPVDLPGVTWTLQSCHTAHWLAANGGRRANAWALCGGLAASALVALILFQVNFYRRRDVARALASARAAERLHAVTTAISAQLGSGHDVLQQLALAARELLGMSKATVGVLEWPAGDAARAAERGPDDATFHVITSVGWTPSAVGNRVPLKSRPSLHQAVVEQRVVLVPDIDRSGLPSEN